MAADLVFRDLGHGLTVLMLLAAIRKMKLNTEERFAVTETLRDVADELENPERVFVQ
jgi:hypothetical protein